MRVFLALNLPAEAREAAYTAAGPLRVVAPRLAWTSADNLHVTVKFLGEQAGAAVDRTIAALAGVAARHEPVTLAIGGVGAFPRLRRPHVLWLGVEPDPKLELLYHDVETACARAGHAVEGRAFRPHLTLARVTRRADVVDAAALASAARRVHFRTVIAAATLDVMLSESGSGGSRYTPLARLPLAARTTVP